MEKKLKISTSKQLTKLVDLMNANPEIGQGQIPVGSNRIAVAQKWQTFADELNLLGPPYRSGENWKRVWINYKANLKRKMQNLLSNSAGEPFTEIKLTDRKESVAEFIMLDKPAKSAKQNLDITPATVADEASDEVKSDVIKTVENDKSSDNSRDDGACFVPKTRLNFKKYPHLLQLKKETNVQKEILSTLQNIEAVMLKNYVLNEKAYELKMKKLETVIEHKKIKMELAKLKIKKLKYDIGDA